jgi:peptidyl-prolyl cis-trans isomerase A (cyclophilin A)
MHLKTCAQLLAALTLAIPTLAQTPAPATKPKSTTTTAAKPAALTYDHALLKPALLKDQAPETYQVKFVTENRDHVSGEFTVTVTRAWAPLGADRFYNLVKHHYFDNARFFRVLPNFVVQFGLSANPAVNAAWEKATIKDDPVTQKNKRGTLVFATAGPDTRTTQLFINLQDNSRDNPKLSQSLDAGGFAPFAVVDGNGMNVVDLLYDQYGAAAGDDQENITKGGEKYLAAHYPKLDTIKSATLIGGAATAPAKPAPKPSTAAKPAAKPGSTTTPKPQQ